MKTNPDLDARAKRSRLRHARLLSLTAVVALVAASCGGDDDAASDTTPAPAATGAPAPTVTTADTEPATTNPATTESATTEPATTTAQTSPPTTEAAGSEPAEFTVMIDGRVDEFNGAFFAYFPDKLTVHPGDTIVYHSMFSGEPHSVAFGDVPQTAVDEFQKLTPEQLQSEGPPPPELEAAFALIPSMLPDGPGDANQNSVNPCFVEAGEEIPTDPAQQCPVTEPSPFT
ncbi:MAG: hypothetical protein ABIP17_06840, partial [Ilumatobacteraceae bacterium]